MLILKWIKDTEGIRFPDNCYIALVIHPKDQLKLTFFFQPFTEKNNLEALKELIVLKG